MKNREKVERYNAEGKLKVLMSSNVTEILKDKVIIDQGGQKIILPNDAVIVSAGGIVPTGLLKSVGINVETKFGTS